MNLRTLVLGCCALLAAGCSTDPEEEEDFAASYFFIDNQTEHPLRVEWKARESSDAEPNLFGPIPSGGRREFTNRDTDALFAPSPSAVFASVALIREDTGARAYVQEPPRDDAWQREVIQVRLGELRTQYTLTVRNEDLTAP